MVGGKAKDIHNHPTIETTIDATPINKQNVAKELGLLYLDNNPDFIITNSLLNTLNIDVNPTTLINKIHEKKLVLIGTDFSNLQDTKNTGALINRYCRDYPNTNSDYTTDTVFGFQAINEKAQNKLDNIINIMTVGGNPDYFRNAIGSSKSNGGIACDFTINNCAEKDSKFMTDLLFDAYYSLYGSLNEGAQPASWKAFGVNDAAINGQMDTYTPEMMEELFTVDKHKPTIQKTLSSIQEHLMKRISNFFGKELRNPRHFTDHDQCKI